MQNEKRISVAYARNMWDKFLKSVKDSRENVLLRNPAIDFTKNAKAGDYDSLSDDEYNDFLQDVEIESSLFRKRACASPNALFLRAFRQLEFSPKEYDVLLQVLAHASSRASFQNDTENTLS